MPVPNKRTSKSLKGMRRSHDAIKVTTAAEVCDNCAEMKLRHHVCGACGFYRGRAVVVTPSSAS